MKEKNNNKYYYIICDEVVFKGVGLFYKETSGEIIIVSYIKISVSTSKAIVYAGYNRRSLNTRMPIAERITIQLFNSLTIQIFNYSREHVRTFISTSDIQKVQS